MFKVSHFVCVRIDDSGVCSALSDVQSRAISFERNLTHIVEDSSKFHITLAVVNLKSPTCEQRAINALQKAISQARRENIRPTLEIRGVNAFNDKVVYAEVTMNPGAYQLYKLAELCREYLTKEGVECPPDQKAFQAHVTLFKVTKRQERVVSSIPPSTYQGNATRHFGYQSISNIQLCAMSKKKDYPLVKEFSL